MKIKKVETNFTQVSNNPLNDSRLSWKAKGVFAYLYSKPDDWDFSSHRIKNDSSDGIDSLLTGLKELEAIGYLKRKRLSNGKVEYTLDYNPSMENPNKAKKPDTENPYKGKSLQGKIHTISNTKNTNNTEEDTKTESPSETDSDSIYPPDFLKFWNLYPKKTGKGDALKSWKKLKVGTSLLARILKSVEEHISSDQWKKDKGRYIPNPSTFLNQRRFDDTVEVGTLDTGASKSKYSDL